MSKPIKQVREVVRLLEREGAEQITFEVTKGTHIRYVFVDPRGQKQVLFGALTPSDHRASRNLAATARRLIRRGSGAASVA